MFKRKLFTKKELRDFDRYLQKKSKQCEIDKLSHRFFEHEPREEEYGITDFERSVSKVDIVVPVIITIVSFFIFLYFNALYLWFVFIFLGFILTNFILRNILRYHKDKRLYEAQVLKQTNGFWSSLDGLTFEKELAKIYSTLGYSATLTKGSGDGGVDIILKNGDETTYVQCKAYRKTAGVAIIRELYGVMKADNVNHGIIACLGGFTKGAIEFAKDNNIDLIELDDIVKMSMGIKKPQ